MQPTNEIATQIWSEYQTRFTDERRIMAIKVLLFIAVAAMVYGAVFNNARNVRNAALNGVVPEAYVFIHQQEDAPDAYSKYDGQAVQHPHRQPDSLVTIKISRYDPALGGTNCFRWANGTCQSPLANGERWEENYGIAIACPAVWQFGTIVEIDGRLWVCKDRGGAIEQTASGAYWVDQLDTTTHFDFGTEMLASVWYPNEQ